MTRLVGLFASVCVLAYLLGLTPLITGQYSHAPVWTVLTVSVEAGIAAAAIVAFYRRSDRWLRWLSFAWSASYVLLNVMWRPLWDGTSFSSDEWPWHLAYSAIAVIYLVPYVSALAAVLAYMLLVPLVLLPAADLRVFDWPFAILHSYAFGGFTILVPMTLHRLAARHDLEEAEARERSAASALAETAVIERDLVDGLIHDSVMSTLLAASRSGSAGAVVASAARALEELEELRDATPGSRPLGIDAFLGSFRSSMHFLDPTLDITVDVDSRMDRLAETVPADVGRALISGAGEAVRNSLRHSGAASPTLSVRIAAEGRPFIRIVIADEGRGFDPASVPTDRLGLRASVHGRVEALTGGSVTLQSAPGRGTRVELAWEKE